MALPFTQFQSNTNHSTSNATTLTIVWNNNNKSGSMILVVFGSGNSTFATVGSITDTSGNIYTKIDSGTNTVDGELWYAKNISATTSVATITINITGGTGNSVSAIAAEYTGVNTSPLDTHATSTGNSATMNSSTTSVTNQSSELVIVWGCVDSSTTPTVGSGFGDLITDTPSITISTALQDKTVTSAGTQTGSINVASTLWVGGIATFTTGNNLLVSKLRPHPFSPGVAR